MSQFTNASSIPYWSPSSQKKSVDVDIDGTGRSGKGLSSKLPSGLAPTAAVFVPKTTVSSGKSESLLGAASSSLSSMNGLNSAAASWTPAGLKEEPTFSNPEPAPVDAGTDEVMVEVTYNGSTFFVPSSTAYMYTNQAEVELEEFGKPMNPPESPIDWTYGQFTVPAPSRRTLQTIGIPDPIRQHFQTLDIEAYKQLPADDDRHNEVPVRYHSIFPLDSPNTPRGAGGSFGYPSSVYKVVDRSDSQIYCLRRFDNVRSVQSTVVKNAIGRWLEIRHPAIVSLYSISQERGGALFFAHAYHPTATTLKQRFIDAPSNTVISEALIWRMLTQLMAGLRLVHSRGVAIRHISPTHILLTSGTIARFNSVGVTDILEFESRKTMTELQLDDIVKLGYVALSMASRVVVTQKTSEVALRHLHQTYSQDLYRVVTSMISGKFNHTHINAMMLDKVQDELDASLASTDALHSHLRSEYENGRMLRLLLKLGFINERPEYAHAPQWSETGDRYVLKLFRDYVFHQTMEDGAPVLDAGHVVSCLNKLDTGDYQKILLCSRDSKDILVVSYSDIRRCLEEAFSELNSLSDSAIARLQTQQQQLQQQTSSVGLEPIISTMTANSAGSRVKLNSSVKSFTPSQPPPMPGGAGSTSLSGTAPVFTPNALPSDYSSYPIDSNSAAEKMMYSSNGLPNATASAYGYGSGKSGGMSGSAGSGSMAYGSNTVVASNVYKSSSRSANAALYTSPQNQSGAYSLSGRSQSQPLSDPSNATFPFPRTSPVYPEYSSGIGGMGNSPGTRGMPLGSGLGGNTSMMDMSRSPHQQQQLHGLPHQAMNSGLQPSIPRSTSAPMYLSQQGQSLQQQGSLNPSGSSSQLYNPAYYDR